MPTQTKKILLALLALLFSATLSLACGGGPAVDADDAIGRSLRSSRDPVEGVWGIYIKWNPDPGCAQSYQMAIVRNTYDVHPEAKYVGVVACSLPGCQRGEVKLLLTPQKRKNAFDAVLLTERSRARGTARLTEDDNGRRAGALDLRNVKYEGKVMASWMLRID